MKVKAPAIKKASGKVVSKKPPAHHVDIIKEHGKGKRGFITDKGKFVDRQEAKKIAKKAGQTNIKGKRGLHSQDLGE